MSEESIWGQVAAWIWSRRAEVGGALADTIRWFRGGNEPNDGRGIVILGAGGTGKSTLGRILGGEYEPLFDAVEPYSESIGVEECCEPFLVVTAYSAKPKSGRRLFEFYRLIIKEHYRSNVWGKLWDLDQGAESLRRKNPMKPA